MKKLSWIPGITEVALVALVCLTLKGLVWGSLLVSGTFLILIWHLSQGLERVGFSNVKMLKATQAWLETEVEVGFDYTLYPYILR